MGIRFRVGTAKRPPLQIQNAKAQKQCARRGVLLHSTEFAMLSSAMLLSFLCRFLCLVLLLVLVALLSKIVCVLSSLRPLSAR